MAKVESEDNIPNAKAFFILSNPDIWQLFINGHQIDYTSSLKLLGSVLLPIDRAKDEIAEKDWQGTSRRVL